jgi:hypothetical protein
MRFVNLRLAGVLRGACDLTSRGVQSAGDVELIWDWSRTLSDIHRFVSDILEPALAEPGRRHQRHARELARPRGAVNWPKTARDSIAAARPGAPRFSCSTTERSLLAPENLLLAATIARISRRSVAVGQGFGEGSLVYPSDYELLRKSLRHVRQALGVPWLAACAEHQRVTGGLDDAGRRELRRQLDARVRGRPCAAPDWARALLEFDSSPSRVPTCKALAELDQAFLWQQLAGLEILSLLCTKVPLRQLGGDFDGFASVGGLLFTRAEKAPAWIVQKHGRPLFGTLCSRATSWRDVRRDALECRWTPDNPLLEVARWLIFHRATDQLREENDPRGLTQFYYCRLEPGRPVSGDFRQKLYEWLETP